VKSSPIPLVCWLAACACQAAPAAEPAVVVRVRCVASERIAIDETVALRGRIEPPPGGNLPVASQVTGRIVQVVVHEGQRLGAGQLVAQIDDLTTRDAARQAAAALAQAQASEANSKATLSRVQALVERGIAPRQELEDAEARAAAAHAGVRAATAAADLARRTLGRIAVHASFDGVVTRVLRGPGALVDGTPATPIVEVAASAAPEFVADATERELSDVAVGQIAEGEIPTEHFALRGTVRARASALDPATGLGTVRIALDVAPTAIPMGAFGRVVVQTRHRDGVRVLPTAALRGAVADGAEVALCVGDHAEVRAIQVGYRDERHVEVLGGVDDRDRVAVDHVLGLSTGTPIVEAK
jgi:RND family efflux transporter MFP subunit